MAKSHEPKANLNPFPQARLIAKGRIVTRSQADTWSIRRSLAFLAAIFAIMFGTLLPSAVAASAASGSPILLCSGDRVMLVYDADGQPKPVQKSMSSLDCAACLMAGMTAIPTPPLAEPPLRIAPVAATVAPTIHADARPPVRGPPRPPSTAPPLA